MSFFSTNPAKMTDAELNAIAEALLEQKAALAERERRAEAKREAEEQEAREKAARERAEKIAALQRDEARQAAEALLANRGIGAGVVGLALALEKRDAVLREVWRLSAELKALGVPAPPLDLRFTDEEHRAARRLAPLVSYEMFENPLASAQRDHPEAFRK